MYLKHWPERGDLLVHRFRKRRGDIRAEVIEVDKTTGRVRVRVRDKVYNSLSAAATAINGSKQNGWIYWGLKRQASYHRRPR